MPCRVPRDWDYTSVFLSGLNLAARDLVEGKWAEAAKTVLDATTYVLTNFGARATALVAALPQMLTTFAGSAIGGTKILVQKTVEIVKQVVASLGTGDWEGAWNAAVDGTLGPSGIPGTLLNLTTGAGVQTGDNQSEFVLGSGGTQTHDVLDDLRQLTRPVEQGVDLATDLLDR